MRILGGLSALALLASIGGNVSAQQAATPAALVQFEKGLTKQTGDVAVPAAHAVLHLGDDYYMLPADEAKKVLTDVWGNPPDAVSDVLGLVLPKGKTVIDNVWGAVVSYEPTGYVADDDAKTADYDQILADIREGEPARNEARTKAGYPASHLIGWAQPPVYDAKAHALVWARSFRVDDDKLDSLNYDVRLLGRGGVLSLNMISDTTHLADVRAAATRFGQAASFDSGHAYADFDPNLDKKAEYGLAGLVAAGVGVAAAKKLGILAIALGFGKKFIVLIVLAFGAVGRWLASRIGKPRDPDMI